MDKRGNHHIIAHSQGQKNTCHSQSAPEGWKAGNSAGVHFFSESPRGPWGVSDESVYCGDIELSNGTHAHMMSRQRPQVSSLRNDDFR